ncbi:hypothetical protein BpHYR1_027731 [Brachionus plicatilis]|uniref:Uncharacterized protein n=1 Tax=Brachionus plicatilis TaxID=10195 RepID=A0A3M7SKL7_BRAPC|nr:hypothetical protein BpHYR1_027731 [Brachionus plicatilis]
MSFIRFGPQTRSKELTVESVSLGASGVLGTPPEVCLCKFGKILPDLTQSRPDFQIDYLFPGIRGENFVSWSHCCWAQAI